MMRYPWSFSRRWRRGGLFLPLSIGLSAFLLVVVGIYIISRLITSSSPGQPLATPHPEARPVRSPAQVSPLIFGSNLLLTPDQEQFFSSPQTLSLLQQLHVHTLRIPLHKDTPRALLTQAMQLVKAVGATPVVVLYGPSDATALQDDSPVVKSFSSFFGIQPVYYEYDSETDLLGISAGDYVASWNAVIPHLKPLAPHGLFIGPANFSYDANYVQTFLEQAKPRPDAISWHEYPCALNWTKEVCLTHIADWTFHITNARALMQTRLHTQLPITITEWNYAANASSDDGKSNDGQFLSTWTAQALQTLASNNVQVSTINTSSTWVTPLISPDFHLTVQGTAFQKQYVQFIAQHDQPTPTASVAVSPPALSPTSVASPTGMPIAQTATPTLRAVHPSPTAQPRPPTPTPPATANPTPAPVPTPTPTPRPAPTNTPAPPPCQPYLQISPGSLVLHEGDELHIATCTTHTDVKLRYQLDGNLVLSIGGVPKWGTGTNGSTAGHVSFQSDGNLVLYNGSNQPLWSSRTDNKGATLLQLQADGNLVIYKGPPMPSHTLWASNTCCYS